ncbi:PorT family protein [Aquimarina sp. ERC-38]|uniref:type IX secretion/gliding motility protein PorT/SprT n=1 Tax=Aquimarina sp. ERC-38 TaxID=2949996 RepID=UPI002246292F|nr:porin family protein [Aquimarina sp. ERC-38]UZO82549.1 PorT family protein [Aquimarina sp. ERC-38]
MKKVVLIILIAFASQVVNAQLFSKERVRNLQNFDKKRLSYGYILGFNSYNFNFDYTADEFDDDIIVQNDVITGFNVGLLGNLRINDYLDLRLEPLVTFSQRNLEFTDPDIGEEFRMREVRSTYIHIPLLLKVSTKRLNNFKPFIVGGLSTSINLSSNEDNPDDNQDGQFRMTTNTSYFELGFGIDFYLHYFKFTPSIRGIFASSDELVRDDDEFSPYTSGIDKLRTQGVFINFTFQ